MLLRRLCVHGTLTQYYWSIESFNIHVMCYYSLLFCLRLHSFHFWIHKYRFGWGPVLSSIIFIIIIAFYPGSVHSPHNKQFPVSSVLSVLPISLSTHLLHASLSFFHPLLLCGLHRRDCLLYYLWVSLICSISRKILLPQVERLLRWPL